MRTLALAVFLAALAFAQSERGNVTGAVFDPAGAGIAAAEISLTHIDTNTSLRTLATTTGEFTFPNVSPGAYRLEVTASGFKRFVRQNVMVSAASTIRVDAQLQLGQVTEAIEVTAALNAVQTEDAKVSTQVETRMVDELPLQVAGSMRSPFNLVAVVPEAQGTGQALSLGGGQVAAWDATLDGHSVGTNRSGDTAEAALNTPSLESLTEFTVDTNGFKAEFGQAGGGILTFASKSGTNKFHGSLYDFARNDAFDARGFFARTKNIYRQHDFGFSASGPLYFPKLYNGRNRTFYFVSYEGFRNRVGRNGSIFTIPTPEMYKGDFRNWIDPNNRMIPIYDPASTRANPNGSGFIRDIFPDNQIPVNRFSAVAAAASTQAAIVQPNRGAAVGTRGYVVSNYLVNAGSLLSPTDKWSVKGDHVFNLKHRVSFLWNSTAFKNKPGPDGLPGLPEPLFNGQIQQWDTNAYRVTHDWTVTSSMINHFSFAWNTFRKNSYSINVDKNWKSKLCIPNVIDCNQNFPTLNFTEYTAWGSASYNGTDQPGWGIKNDFSYLRKGHTFKFGFQHQNQNANGFGQQDIAGRADFSFLSTSIPGSTVFPASGGSSFASFLLGQALLGRTETIREVTQRYLYFGFYVQDDWRITRRLVLNLGPSNSPTPTSTIPSAIASNS
ncbi:MAG: carboxypeptidase-like regulatory domain-containing protein [Anaeromyxobacter sp.]